MCRLDVNSELAKVAPALLFHLQLVRKRFQELVNVISPESQPWGDVPS